MHINKENYLACYKPAVETVLRKIDIAKSSERERLSPVGRMEIEKL